MTDHTTPIMVMLASTLDNITMAMAEQQQYDETGERSDVATLDDLVLCVDTEIIRDVMLGVGGPTTFVRFIFDSGAKMARNDEHAQDELKSVEFHYSWGANDITSVTLSDDESAAMVDAFGWMVGLE